MTFKLQTKVVNLVSLELELYKKVLFKIWFSNKQNTHEDNTCFVKQTKVCFVYKSY